MEDCAANLFPEARKAMLVGSFPMFFLWEVVLPLSIATWNVPGLFGSTQSSQERVRWKQGYAAQLLTAHQVVALQEVHEQTNITHISIYLSLSLSLSIYIYICKKTMIVGRVVEQSSRDRQITAR